MPKFTPIEWRRLERIFLAAGFRFVRQEGSHRSYVKDGVARPVVIPAYHQVPVFVIRNNLKTAGNSKCRPPNAEAGFGAHTEVFRQNPPPARTSRTKVPGEPLRHHQPEEAQRFARHLGLDQFHDFTFCGEILPQFPCRQVRGG